MDFFSRMERSWRLIKASTRVLNDDGELLLLPLLSGVFTIALCGALYYAAVQAGAIQAFENGQSLEALNTIYIWLFLFYLVQYCVVFFFNTALVAAAIQRLDGGDPTIRSALAVASRRIFQIFGYAVIAATVGILLRALADRGGIIGKLLAAGAALAWSVVTFLVIPVIAVEGRNPVDAIERSTELLSKTWGENLLGNAGINILLGLVGTVIGLVGLGGATLLIEQGHQALGIPLFAAGFLALMALAIFGSALSAVYAAAVYYYAVVGEPPEGFDRDLVRSAFMPKGGETY